MKMMMNRLYKTSMLLTLCVVALAAGCKEDDEKPQLSISIGQLSIPAEGNSSEMTITSNDSWTISNSAPEWLQVSKSAGNDGTTTVQISAPENTSNVTRSALLVVKSHNGQSRRITVSQAGALIIPALYPNYNTSPKDPDATGMSSTAVELAAKMTLGWNIGNTMEASGGETSWGNPQITEDYVKFVKANGFNAIRIPCAWDLHVDNQTTAHINESWLNRVKEVVGYCVDNDMYVLLNIHWDGGWLENNFPKTQTKQDSVNAKQKALWEQIATAMRDFDEHLMFASANEPNADDASETAILATYHQIFVKAVRSTGGRNTYRVLVVQGPSTNMTLTPQLMTTLPTDPTANRLMVEVHNYLPAQFCFLNEDADWGTMAYYWGKDHQSTIEPSRNFTADWGNEVAQIEGFDGMRTSFVDKGIPVLIGEYGAYRRNTPKDLATHNDAVDYWITFVTKQAKTRGMIPFWWDTGGALDRTNLMVKDQRTIDAIIAGGQ
jgi:aryl-phospho-beta-D-glucosidase BglC (GH1 family)